jgi:hypothetical protein
MKRPVVGTISILALLAAGVYLAFLYKDAPQDVPVRCYEGAAARAAIQSSLEFSLPPGAADVHCCIEALGRTQLVFARFDVSPIELPGLFGEQPRYPGLDEFKADPQVRQSMAAMADASRPWWQVGRHETATFAHRSGQRNVPPAALRWRVQVATAQVSTASTRVYVAFSEEPQADAKP